MPCADISTRWRIFRVFCITRLLKGSIVDFARVLLWCWLVLWWFDAVDVLVVVVVVVIVTNSFLKGTMG